ncbi:MAG: L-2-amino-thiazoline-4-carboxylic acid hydrolase [Syntrophaceae bacterium]|nr:L-2-amino-thiazoline-4-carboxylic acid hydrolase [Syntrophaceae bacterium]
MLNIRNEPRYKGRLIRAIRSTLEHRATWLYLLLDEAEKQGIRTEEFAKAAIMRCGCFQGEQLVADARTQSLKGLKKKLFTLPARIVFEMKILSCTDDRLEIDFHYCPLMAAWQYWGASDDQIARLCDITMQGDRGIAASFGCELELGRTIAKGYDRCEIRFKRLKEG